mmetsp:Transcript_6304/g.12478  ORF Transcript_6304/g.12478 Transcript_6304/m.12478 type:complete len:115 (+) Transcript_6304:202-546(+)
MCLACSGERIYALLSDSSLLPMHTFPPQPLDGTMACLLQCSPSIQMKVTCMHKRKKERIAEEGKSLAEEPKELREKSISIRKKKKNGRALEQNERERERATRPFCQDQERCVCE